MRYQFSFWSILIIMCVIMWYMCEALLWFEFLVKAYTPFSRELMIMLQHAIFLGIPLGLRLLIYDPKNNKKYGGWL